MVESIEAVAKNPLFKLVVGILIALAVKLYKKSNGVPTHEDWADEVRTLLIPALMVGVGFLALDGSWVESLEAFLLSIAVPLGLVRDRTPKMEDK